MADSSKDIQLHELKDMINDLKKMIKTLQATVDAANKREESLTQERDNLKEEIDLLRKKLFGTSSEKRTIDIPGQLNFFNEAELEQNPEAVKAEDLEALSSCSSLVSDNATLKGSCNPFPKKSIKYPNSNTTQPISSDTLACFSIFTPLALSFFFVTA